MKHFDPIIFTNDTFDRKDSTGLYLSKHQSFQKMNCGIHRVITETSDPFIL